MGRRRTINHGKLCIFFHWISFVYSQVDVYISALVVEVVGEKTIDLLEFI